MRSSARAPVLFAAAGGSSTALFVLLPSGGAAQGAVFVSVNAASVTALCVRVVRGALAGSAWRVLAVAQVLYLVAVVGWYLYPVGLDRSLPYPSWLDVAFWAAYLGWAGFLVLGSRLRAGIDRGVEWEALAAALGLGALAWRVLLEPALDATSVSAAARAASVVYPMLLLGLAAMGVRLALTSRRASAIDALLIAWLVLELAGNVWYSVASADGSFRYGHPWFVSWMLSYTAFGAMVLHRDGARVAMVAEHQRLPPPIVRAAVLGSIVAIAMAAIASEADGAHRFHTGAMATLAGLAMWIILFRFATTARDLASERQLHDELTHAYAELERASTHDPLTGLANRAAFDAFLPRALARRRPAGQHACLLLVDLDSFKAVNDTYGHLVGDALLRVTGARLAELVRPGDLVARLGGDEFAVVVDDGDLRTVLLLAERIGAALRQPAQIGQSLVVPSASVGAHAAGAEESPAEAMLSADTALYAAKAAGSVVEVFDATRHRAFFDRFQIERDLRAAVMDDDLTLHYQPVFELRSRRVVTSEALVRWNHPTRGLLGPGQFIEVAETSGAIVDVGRWVLDRACRDAHRWQTLPGGSGVGVAVNLSRRQLQSRTVLEDIRAALDSTDLDPALLTLEVTETALMADTAEMVAQLEKIRALGVTLAMDDFGTGYSSLSHLRALPVELLKIDKAFVDGIAREQEEWALAAAIIRLATSLRKRTLAEGIERASQLAHLRALGCEFGQGWLFARAMPLEEFTAFLAPRDPRQR